jgi:hypothetical protein
VPSPMRLRSGVACGCVPAFGIWHCLRSYTCLCVCWALHVWHAACFRFPHYSCQDFAQRSTCHTTDAIFTIAALCRQSLAELGTPYVDMFLLHAPGDPATRADTWRALEEAVREVRTCWLAGQR